MMKRKNIPSAKVSMQVIIGEVLESKNQLSTNEFISKLEARGVKVLFNQASTGYVSGISYSYQGLVMQGYKLGNGFKWSTVKNIINYEQERDRQRIHEASVRSEHAIHQLRAGNNHARGNTANTQGSVVKYGRLPDSGKVNGRYILAHHSELQSLTMQLDSLNAKLEEASTLFSKSRKCSLWERYWTAVTVGVISALLTNLLLMML